jgi:hypothetical protein
MRLAVLIRWRSCTCMGLLVRLFVPCQPIAKRRSCSGHWPAALPITGQAESTS